MGMDGGWLGAYGEGLYAVGTTWTTWVARGFTKKVLPQPKHNTTRQQEKRQAFEAGKDNTRTRTLRTPRTLRQPVLRKVEREAKQEKPQGQGR
jgi:hypothetical protein